MSENSWRPSATRKVMHHRAEMLQKIRQFMASRGVLEVDTPVLGETTVTDVHIESFTTSTDSIPAKGDTILYLQTSPEYYMKRLLADGSGPIYQIAHVFRNEETGIHHQLEFTLLEWYQTGYDQYQLMAALDDLLSYLGFSPATRYSYPSIFYKLTGVDPVTTDLEQLQNLAEAGGLVPELDDRSALLDFCFSHYISPWLREQGVIYIHDFPECQAALARLNPAMPGCAERFELFINGLEIANGFHELSDPTEQEDRFNNDIDYRIKTNRQALAIDQNLLAALESGLPDCSGVAIGLDRLLMIQMNLKDIRDVITFPIDRN